MQANLLVKSLLHFVAAILIITYAVLHQHHSESHFVALLTAGISFAALIFLHPRILPRQPHKTSMLLLIQSFVLAFIAYHLYQQGQHKATFLYEGVSVLYLSLAAFNFLLRRKPTVFFSEEEQQEIKQQT